MATNTPNYNLVKPSDSDLPDQSVLNGNMDKIDTAIKANATNIGLFDYKGAVAVGADFNNLTSGLWLYEGYAAINAPGSFGLVYVESRPYYKLQIMFATNAIRWRLNTGTGWPTWRIVNAL